MANNETWLISTITWLRVHHAMCERGLYA